MDISFSVLYKGFKFQHMHVFMRYRCREGVLKILSFCFKVTKMYPIFYMK